MHSGGIPVSFSIVDCSACAGFLFFRILHATVRTHGNISTEQSPRAIPTCIRFSSLSSGTINYNFELIRCQVSLSTGGLVRLVTIVCSHRQFVSWRSLNLSRFVACVCFTDTVHRLLPKKEAIEFKPRRPYLAYTRPTLSHRTHGATLALSQITKLAGSPRTCQGPLDGRM